MSARVRRTGGRRYREASRLFCCRVLRLWPSVHIPDNDGLVGLERALEIELRCHLAHRREDFLAEQADARLGILV